MMGNEATRAAVTAFSLAVSGVLILVGIALGVLAVTLDPSLTQSFAFFSGGALGLALSEMGSLKRRI